MWEVKSHEESFRGLHSDPCFFNALEIDLENHFLSEPPIIFLLNGSNNICPA
jgi:hypothetical protein